MTAPLCSNSADQGKLVLDFDDLPVLQLAPDTDYKDVAPVLVYSPYHRFVWSEGFKALPTSAAMFKPSSGDVMIEFSAVEVGSQRAAKISVGTLRANPCFQFDFTSFRVGCASTADCEFNVTGFSWDNEVQTEVAVGSHVFITQGCLGQQDCSLVPIVADESANLTSLTSLLIDVTAGGQPQKWWADDLTLAWSDASCEMAACRSNVRDTIPKRGRRHGMARIGDAHY